MSELIELNPDEREKMIAYSNQRRDMLHKKSVDRVAAALRDKLNGARALCQGDVRYGSPRRDCGDARAYGKDG